MTGRQAVITTSIFFLLSVSSGLLATEWHVAPPPLGNDGNPGSNALPFATIQRGIDASSGNDTVIVAAGTYLESIQFKGKNIVLRSTDPRDSYVVAGTVIDGNGAWSVVAFSGTETEACTLSGFTITKGSVGIVGSTWPDPPTHATIENSIITGVGGGVSACAGIIQNNSITGNSGGGLYNCDGIIRNNTIIGNTASDGGAGLRECDGVVEYNTIMGNGARDSGGRGGGLWKCDAIIQNNTIVANSSNGSGGGLSGCNGLIQNNTISGNAAFYNGGGLHDCDGTIRSNTIADNSVGTYGGGLYGCGGPIRNCILWGNTAGDITFGFQLYDSSVPSFSCIEGWPGGGLGNINTDPHLVDATAYNYRLQEGSPCIDAGANEEWMWTATDLDWNERIANGGLSLTVDMGAYEYGSSSPFRITQLLMTGGFQLTWVSRPGDQYVIWSCTDLTSATWAQGQTVPSAGDFTSWTDASPSGSRKFYKVQLK